MIAGRAAPSSPRSGFLWSLLGDGAAKLALLASSAIALLALEVAQFGLLASIQAAAYLSAALWDFGSGQLLIREIAAGRVEPSSWLHALKRVRLLTLPLGLGALAAALALVLSASPGSGWRYLMALAATLAIGSWGAAVAALTGRMEFGHVARVVAASRWAGLAVGVVLLLVTPADARLDVLLLAWLLGESIGALIALRLALRNGTTRGVALRLRDTAPLAMNSVVQIAYNRFDIVLIASLSSPAIVGAYATASRIQDALFLLPSAGSAMMLPFASHRHSGEQEGTTVPADTRRLLRKTWTAVGVPSLAIALLVVVGAPHAVPFLLGPTYEASIVPIQIVALSAPIVALNAPLASVVIARGQPAFVTLGLIGAFATVLAVNLSLIQTLGARAPALAATLREVPVFVILLVGARRSGLFGARRSAR